MFRFETIQMRSLKIWTLCLRVVLAPALMIALNVGCSSGVPESEGSPSTAGAPNPPPNSQIASIFISCPSQVLSESSGSCTATVTGTVNNLYWILNGTKVPGSEGLTSVAWATVGGPGTHKVQAVGKDSMGMNVASNIATVVVLAAAPGSTSIVITCPGNLLTHGTGTCTSVIKGNIVSGTWIVNGSPQPEAGRSLSSYTWVDIASPGTYVVQLVGKTADGATVTSNSVSVVVSDPVIVLPPQPSLSIVCPLTVPFGGSPTCTATITGSVVAGFWAVNDTKVADSDNMLSYTWVNVRTPGTYKVQAFGTAADGSVVSSNILMVTIQPE